MQRAERLRLGALAAALVLTAPAFADETAFRFRAPISITTPGPFVQLPLPASVYARSLQPGLQDLRIVDANGERVPFAILAPRAAELRSTEQQRAATLYPLPERPAADGHWAAPVDITVEGGSVRVKRLGAGTGTTVGRSGGWLVDLGERRRDEPAPRSLRMLWSGPAEFSAAYRFDTSDDLRAWRFGGAGQLLAFRAEAGALAQPTIALPAGAGRFVRLVWADAAAAPAITGALVVAATQRSVAIDPPTEIVLPLNAAPPGTAGSDEAARRALEADLGGVLPLVEVDLRLPAGRRVAPVRLQGRSREGEPWRELGSTVFYRLERGGETSRSPPLALAASARWLRVLPDPRAAALDAAQTQLVVQAALASLVFAQQGQPPFTLLAGAQPAPQALAAALDVASLVPALDDERPRFGRATLGAWSEVDEVARAAEQQRRRAALRPWLLWSVLLAGVGGLGFMVWRLTRPSGAGP